MLVLVLVASSSSSSINPSSSAPFAPFKGSKGGDEGGSDLFDKKSILGSRLRNPEREQLYEAYNLLHTLAQVRTVGM